ncbi:MAG TPA: hypothetical protein IGS52_03935 [Oscillatoriaceae cyanobacterium M33_DOE_052]|uniref:Uncharacterized protein n=1 Tax=Planktothricoides sp. SpSt-374 TaxID=2282167 RepID=A0A7C3ZSU6_9CYAN|nr:hypothetical protein [Oscillatoriaceae cyanobacterium M33_DOE_052]
MQTVNNPVSCCRGCRHYQLEGRRGGFCHQLNVPVQANWKACPVASPSFTTPWKTHPEGAIWPEKAENLR